MVLVLVWYSVLPAEHPRLRTVRHSGVVEPVAFRRGCVNLLGGCVNLLFGGVDVAPVEDVAAGTAVDVLRAVDVRAIDVVLQQEEEDEAQDGGGQYLKVFTS